MLGKTQECVAEACKVSRSTIQRICNEAEKRLMNELQEEMMDE